MKDAALLTVVLLVSLAFLSVRTYGQNTNIALAGTVQGEVRDSLHNHSMGSATVSLYLAQDGRLLSFQVSNKLGEFHFERVPLATDLKLVVSNIGYSQAFRNFRIDSCRKSKNLGTVYLNRKINTLEEVMVTVPPVQMNGDTLEFNASAYKLDSNAVVLDLLKKIPNITQWGDGTITVNGREIKSLLVNGREFLGGDLKLSIENIPKMALEKIQVYNTVDNPKNRQDSSLNMNLKLKKGKDVGFFGKLGGGLGTNGRFESDVSFNVFSPKLQLSVVGAINNVNKIPADINTILRNSTFRGVGVELDYMPDFRMAGINSPAAAGYSLTYDLRDPTSKSQNRNRINSEYFLNSNNIRRRASSTTTTSIGDKTDITDAGISSSRDNRNSQRFNAGYQYGKDRYNIHFSQTVNLDNGSSVNRTSNTSSDGKGQQVSKSSSESSNKDAAHSYSFQAGINYQPYLWSIDPRFSGFEFNYKLNVDERKEQRQLSTIFESFNNSLKDQSFNRHYNKTIQTAVHSFDFSLPGIIRLLFGVRKFELFEADLRTKLEFHNTTDHNIVSDYNGAAEQFVANQYLSNKMQDNAVLYAPAISLNRLIKNSLTNRFDKIWRASFDFTPQFYYQNTRSDKEIQNINRLYANYLPSATVSYEDNQYGEYRKMVSLNYQNKIRVPEIGLIAPLTDSADVYFLRRANLSLKQERTESLVFNYKWNNDRKDDVEYSLGAKYEKVHDNIIDSIRVNEQNIRTIYAINNSNSRSYNFSGAAKKAFKLTNANILLNYNMEYSYLKTPSIINETENRWTTRLFNSSAKINYTYKNLLAIEGKQQIVKSVSRNNELSFYSSNLASSLSMSWLLLKKMRLNSNVTSFSTRVTGSDPINYTIWNASVVYRFFKRSDLEVKISILDILGQNTSVLNRNQGGVLTVGTQDVLQQYVVLGVSYYPRRFGKR